MEPMALWKRVFILIVCAWGIVAALPNAFYAKVESHNDAVAAIAAAGGTATPEQEAAKAAWPAFLPSALMNLGLDLRGGAHLLAEVQVEDVYKARMDALWPEIRDALRDLRDQVVTAGGIVAKVSKVQDDGMVEVEIADGVKVKVVKHTITQVLNKTEPAAS